MSEEIKLFTIESEDESRPSRRWLVTVEAWDREQAKRKFLEEHPGWWILACEEQKGQKEP